MLFNFSKVILGICKKSYFYECTCIIFKSAKRSFLKKIIFIVILFYISYISVSDIPFISSSDISMNLLDFINSNFILIVVYYFFRSKFHNLILDTQCNIFEVVYLNKKNHYREFYSIILIFKNLK